MAPPTSSAALTKTIHHDIYPAISPSGALAGAAKGLSVFVTGAGRGIGRSLAIVFAQAGAAKVTLVSRSTDELAEVAKEVKAVNVATKVTTAVVDVTNEESVRAAFDGAGQVDVLINNAGFSEDTANIHESRVDQWWKTWEVNLKGTYIPTREVICRKLANKTSPSLTIINTSSLVAAMTTPGWSSYQVNKTAINRFTEFIHFEYEDEGIRTFAYHPGTIQTTIAIPPKLRQYFIDTTDLAAGFALWLATGGERVDFLRGRFVAANWDVDELLAKKDEILARDLLWTRVVGQEQVMQK